MLGLGETSASVRILVLRPGAIGDTLLTLPALQALRQHFPTASIEVAGNATGLPLVGAAGVIDRWVPFDDARVTRLFMPGSPAADDAFHHLDVAVAWIRDPDGTLAAALSLRGASQVIVEPSRPPPDRPLHVARHLLQALAPLGIDPSQPLALPELRLPDGVVADARDGLAAAGLNGRPFVAVHAGSGSAAKNWPARHFSAVVDALAERHRLPCVILGGPADGDVLVALSVLVSRPLTVLVNRPLLIVAALLRQASAFLGNDSGLSHLAGLLGVPTLTLFGPSDPTHWSPLGPRVRVLRSEPLVDLAPEQVVDELTSMLDLRR